MMNNKDKMHPEDIRNLIIFVFASLLIWFLYETYVLAPQAKALKQAKEARKELILKDPQLLNPVKEVARDFAIKETINQRIKFANKEVSGSILLKGGLIDDLALNNYFKTLEKKENVEILTPPQTKNSRYIDYGWVSGDRSIKLPNAATIWSIKGNRVLKPNSPVTLIWDNGQGFHFERIIRLDDQYMFSITQRVYNNSGRDVELHSYALISQTDIPRDYAGTWVSHEGPIGFIDGALEKMSYSAMVKEPNKKIEASRGWIGISDKYWLTAILPKQDQLAKYRFKYIPDPVTRTRNRYQTDYTSSAMPLVNGGKVENTYNLYVGAKKVFTLEEYQEKLGIDNLDLAVDFGWFWFFTYPLFVALHYISLMVGNVGVAIIILTAILRTAVFPLTNFSYRSFAKMKLVAPQITELREKYKDNKEELQAAIVKLYQKEEVNPMSGCLPILVQIPIFFAFYKILFSTIEIRHAPFFGWIQDLSAQDPTTIFNLFGLIPWDAPQFLMIGAWPCMMLVVMLVQKHLNPPPQDKLQRDMMTLFPFFITFIMAKFASGLVIYWTFSALFSVIQQMIIMRSMGVPIYLFNKDEFKEELEKKVEEGPDVHPLIEMAEEEAEKALFGDGEAINEQGEDISESEAGADADKPNPKSSAKTKSKAKAKSSADTNADKGKKKIKPPKPKKSKKKK